MFQVSNPARCSAFIAGCRDDQEVFSSSQTSGNSVDDTPGIEGARTVDVGGLGFVMRCDVTETNTRAEVNDEIAGETI